MTKYKEYFDSMLSNHKELFDEFKQVHDEFHLQDNPSGDLRAKFNEIGKNVLSVIREWEDKLCGRSEGSGYASYSGGLAQKFQDEIRKVFPMIDHVGIIVDNQVSPAPAVVQEPLFEIKKINL